MSQASRTLSSRLLRRARSEPARVGWIQGETRWTYAALVERVRVRLALLRRHDVAARARVISLVADPLDFVVTLFAAELLGARVLAFDPRAEARDVREAAGAVDASLALVDPRDVDRWAAPLRAAGVELVDASSRIDTGYALADDGLERGGERPLLYLYTSGSVGGLKRVCRTSANLLAEGEAFVEAVGLTPADPIACVVPLWHSYGLGNGFLAALVSGAPLVLLPEAAREPVPFAARVAELSRQLSAHGVRALVAVPFQYRVLTEAASIGGDAFAPLRWCFSSGGPLPAQTFDGFVSRFGLPIRQIYGSTETGTIAVNLAEGPAFRSSSVGRPVGATRIRVVGPEGEPAPEGHTGEIWARGPALPAAGYDAAPPEERLAFRDGWYRTGDLGRLDERGELTIVQRKRTFIEVGGDKVVVAEVESALLEHPDVIDAAVVGVDAAGEGQRVKAAIVCHERLTDDALRGWCRSRLAEHKIPALFERREALPRTALGKIDRRALRDPSAPSHRLAIDHSGVLGRLAWRACQPAPPGPGEVQIAVEVAGLNFLDVLSALGVIPDDAPGADAAGPRLGSECAGRVVALGAGVDELALGQPVIAIGLGVMRRHVTLPASLVAPRPSTLSAVEGAALPVASVTAWYALHHVARLAAGERVLIHAATGGVGLAAVQIAASIGAEIYATAGSPRKRDELRRMGIARVYDSRSLDFDADVLGATGGEGVDVVLNSLGGAFIERSLALLRDDGRFVELGKKDYYADRPLGLRPFLRGLQLALVDLRGMICRSPHRVGRLLREVAALAERGVLRPRIDREVPGVAVIDAFRSMQEAEHIGKIVIEIADPAIRARPAEEPPERGTASLLTGPLEARRRQLRDHIRRRVEVIRRTTIERLDPEASLASYGLDSLSSVALTRELGALLGARLPSTILWDHPTLGRLVDALLELVERGSSAVTPDVAGRGAVTANATAAIDAHDEPIAVVSLACRFPGGIETPEALWEVLEAGRDVLGPFPDNRGWDLEGRFDADPGVVGTIAAERGGFLDEPGAFDPAHFGISEHEARTLDPQHRLLLELAWEAFERAGMPPDRQLESATGVFVGVWQSGYGSRAATRTAVDGHPLLGTETSLAAGRIAYTFGLRGPAIAIDTACSSSLVALHLACQALRAGECERALVGGATIYGDLASFLAFSRMRVLSPTGICRPFAAGADGAVWSEGGGLVLLERLSEARRRGHPVLALIRGSALNQDGRTQGITAPCGPSQQQVIDAALAAARVPAAAIDFVEAHGTGTALGDPIEAGALRATYGQARAEGPVWVGAVKANLGHTQAAAGIAGLMKVVLALQRQRLPATPHVDAPSPQLGWEGSRLRLLTTSVAWPRGQRPRRAGVSSFGVAGTNAHVIVEEAPAAEPAGLSSCSALSARCDRVERPALARCPSGAAPPSSLPLVLSGSSPAGLRAQAASWARWLRENPGLDLTALRRTAALRRGHLAHRAAIQATDVAEAVAALDAVTRDEPRPTTRVAPARDLGRPVFVFPGHGGQWPAMGRALLAESSAFTSAVEACDAALRPYTGWSILAVLRGDEDARTPPLERVDVLQPAIFTMGVALASVWRALGIEPAAALGHSVGEIAAAVVAEALSLADGARLVALRGQAIARIPRRGAMLAVAMRPDAAAARLDPWRDVLSLAVINASTSVVVAGDVEAVAALAEQLRAERVLCRAVNIGFAAHSQHMDDAVAELRRELRELRPRAAVLPFYSAVTGGPLDGASLDLDYWLRNVRDVVRFDRAVASLVADDHRCFIELGGHPALGLALREATADRGAVLGSLRRGHGGLAEVHSNLGALHVHGGAVDFARLLGEGPWVAAPTQAFVRRRYWAGAEDAQPAQPRPSELREDEIRRTIRRIVAASSRLRPEQLVDTADLVDLGLDSIALISITGELRSRFGVAIEVTDLLQAARTIDGLVRRVVSRRAAASPAAHARPRPERGAGERTLRRYTATDLEPAARRHLDEVIRRLHAKTPGSRAAASPGGPLADPRGTAGWYPDMSERAARTWAALEPTRYPLVVRGAAGARVEDVDGNHYVDLCMGFGVHLFGHKPAFVTEAIEAALRRGAAVGPQSHLASDVARRLAALTGMDRVALCNTGSEAVSMALRLARARTGRQRIALTVGAYHGTGEAAVGNTFLREGAHAATLADTITIAVGDPQAFDALERHRDELAAVLVEPVQSSRPDLADGAFLRELRERTRAWGIALIFDEVLIGFRLGLRGAQGRFGVEADLATYGKLVGGGLPIGVVAGRGAWLDWIDGGARVPATTPTTPRILFGGTFSKNPLTMAGAQAVLARLERDGETLLADLERRTARLAGRLNGWFEAEGFDARVASAGSLFRFLLPPGGELLGAHLLLRGIYVWEGRSCFLSEAHTEADIEAIIAAVQDACLEMRSAGFWSGRAAQQPSTASDDRGTHAGEATEVRTLAAAASRPSLTRLRDGAGPPLLLIPGIEGSLVSLLGLARSLPPGPPVLGLEDPGHREPRWRPASLGELAQRYLDELEPALDVGRVRLVGYSFGGRVALEMAARLVAGGRRVERVLLLDEAADEGYSAQVDWRDTLTRLCAGLGLSPPPRAELSAMGRARALEHLGRRASIGVAGLRSRLDVATRNQRLAAAWVAPRLDVPLTLLRVADGRAPRDLGWGAALAGTVDVRIVPGDHVSMMRSPAVNVTADRIAESLDPPSMSEGEG